MAVMFQVVFWVCNVGVTNQKTSAGKTK